MAILSWLDIVWEAALGFLGIVLVFVVLYWRLGK